MGLEIRAQGLLGSWGFVFGVQGRGGGTLNPNYTINPTPQTLNGVFRLSGILGDSGLRMSRFAGFGVFNF